MTSAKTPKRLVAEQATLEEVVEESRRLGFLGPGDIHPQIEHARRFGAALHEGWGVERPLVADLGAGGGLPSLPIAMEYEATGFVLVDALGKRTSFLVWATVALALTSRVEVWRGRAEVFGRDGDRRGGFDGVVARGFGPPADTVECAAPLLRPGGRCVISEPPGPRSWPADGLAEVGLRQVAGPEGFAVFERDERVIDAYPRPVRERKRAPLFEL